MKLIYDINDRPGLGKTIVFAFQQMIAIMAATLLVPMIMTGYTNGAIKFDPAAALCGAGIGTLIYLLFTKRRSPVFLGSSFTFLGAYEAVLHANYGYWGVIIGIAFAGLVYVVLALIIKATGSGWVNKLMPAVIIGPIVALIGLSLSGTATGWMSTNGGADYSLLYILVGACTFLAIVFASIKGTKGMKLIPFIIGIVGAYIIALIFTFIGNAANIDALKLVNLSAFDNMQIFKVPRFTFLGIFGAYEDATNKIGSFFGGCPNTTYGESVGCVAITGNASISTIAIAAVYCIILSFFDPFVCFVNSIPSCIVGGVCIALYGFIAVSGLKMLQPVDLNDNRNLFVVAAILVPGIGGLTLNFGAVTVSSIATGLILGIIINVLFNKRTAR